MNKEHTAVIELINLLKELRTGTPTCPWASQQTFHSLIPYTLEEAYEVADAIERNDMQALLSELGDLLYQVVFYTQIAEELGLFNLNDVAQQIIDKHNTRMPDLLDEQYQTAEDINRHWQNIKTAARQAKLAENSLFSDIPPMMPSLLKAHKIQTRAADVGFDWDNAAPVFEKLNEEIHELDQALAECATDQRLSEEMGDILFTCVNLARHLEIDPESALRDASQKFIHRMQIVAKLAKNQDIKLSDCDLEQLELFWNEAKTKPFPG